MTPSSRKSFVAGSAAAFASIALLQFETVLTLRGIQMEGRIIGIGTGQHRHPASARGVGLVRGQCIGHRVRPALVRMSRQLDRDWPIVKPGVA